MKFENNPLNEKILITEDDPGLMELIKESLSDLPFIIIETVNGNEALSCLVDQKIDLMILDYNLPDMNGGVLISRLKKEGLSIPPFIVITGLGDERVAVEMMKQGAKDYLVKDKEFLEMLPQTVKKVQHQLITERKLGKAEEEIKSKNRILQTILDGIPDIINLQTPDHELLVYNKAACLQMGVDAQELVGKKCHHLIKRSVFCEHCAFEIAKTKKQTYAIEKYFPELDQWIECRATPVLDELGSVVYMVEHLRDISERKHSEQALKESERRLNLAQELIGLGSWEYDPATHLTIWSPQMFKIHGLDSKEAVPEFSSLVNMIHPEDREKWIKSNEAVSKQGTFSPFEFRIIHPDGQCRWVLAYEAQSIDQSNAKKKFYGTLLDITERKKMEMELEFLATTDCLSGVYNRRMILEIAGREFALVKRYSRPLSLLMMDIDHFKSVNDEYGHQAGDEVLKGISEECRNFVRKPDIIGRIGGEEFLILLPETGKEDAMLMANRLREAIATCRFTFQNQNVYVTVSIGMTLCLPEDKTLDEVIRRSDKALYKAKNAGRNRVESEE